MLITKLVEQLVVVVKAGLADALGDDTGRDEPAPRDREPVEVKSQRGDILHVSFVISK
jgi:hypothetical protein